MSGAAVQAFCTVDGMTVAIPTTLDEALTLLAADPTATLLAGGTDAMVEVNDGHRRPGETVIALRSIAELHRWAHDPAARSLTIGAGLTYTELMEPPLCDWIPALAEASRTVGSPQIRNAGTLGGNLGTCSPAGDGLPVLSALDAEVRLVSTSGERTLPVHDFMIGVKQTALEPGELIADVRVPVIDGWQGYAKVGIRNAMVIAIASVCLVVDRRARSVAVSIGSVGPTVLRCPEAEAGLQGDIDWDAMAVDPQALDRFGASVAAESRPITDHRSTERYRRHAVGVLARRLGGRALEARGAAA